MQAFGSQLPQSRTIHVPKTKSKLVSWAGHSLHQALVPHLLDQSVPVARLVARSCTTATTYFDPDIPVRPNMPNSPTA